MQGNTRLRHQLAIGVFLLTHTSQDKLRCHVGRSGAVADFSGTAGCKGRLLVFWKANLEPQPRFSKETL